ncbi:UDP-4-amino-4-deoxy-L-arabinose--oxoglutarate aminotransferase [Candidatus Methanoperedenaceae archaeon GB37]|nr:UDP-4-amino-4-deoxy-L-arabinose--oxoglutarate aminotransferase [Candidatus Methanoperedenaceae archaeon GB37]
MNFFSLPPSGNPIPISHIFRATSVFFRNTQGEDGFQEIIKTYLKVKHCLLVSSGTAALWLILKAAKEIEQKRNEVIIPAYTCPSVAAAVIRAGLKPILCDINMQDFGFELEALKKKINFKTLAIIIVHLFGFPSNIKKVKQISRSSNILLIEDAAQALGNSMINSPQEKLGSLGDIGFYSFGRGKPLTLNHGGLIVTNNSQLFEQIFQIYQTIERPSLTENFLLLAKLYFYVFFFHPSLYWIPQSIPFLKLGKTIFDLNFKIKKTSPIAVALANKSIGLIEENKKVRQKNTTFLLQRLNSFKKINLPAYPFPYLRFPLIVSSNTHRNRLLALPKGARTRSHYVLSLSFK